MRRLVDNAARLAVALTAGGFLVLAIRNNCAPATPVSPSAPNGQAATGCKTEPSLYRGLPGDAPEAARALERALLEQLSHTALLGESDPLPDRPSWRRSRAQRGLLLLLERTAASAEAPRPALRVLDRCTGALLGLALPALPQGGAPVQAAALRAALFWPEQPMRPALALGEMALEEKLPAELREELLWRLRREVLRTELYRWVEPREWNSLAAEGGFSITPPQPDLTLFVVVQHENGALFGSIEIRDGTGTQTRAKLQVGGRGRADFFDQLADFLFSVRRQVETP